MSEVNKEFIEFGNKMFILFILAIISVIAAIIGWAVPALGFINLIMMIVYFVFLILARGHIVNANKSLNNEDLDSFCKRIIVAIITAIIGSISFQIGITGIYAIAYGSAPGAEAAIVGYIVFGLLALVGIILLIIALIFDILAWSDMKGFFRDNKNMFPEDKAKNAETGSLLMMLGAIPFAGFILRIIGSYFLSQLKDLE